MLIRIPHRWISGNKKGRRGDLKRLVWWQVLISCFESQRGPPPSLPALSCLTPDRKGLVWRISLRNHHIFILTPLQALRYHHSGHLALTLDMSVEAVTDSIPGMLVTVCQLRQHFAGNAVSFV